MKFSGTKFQLPDGTLVSPLDTSEIPKDTVFVISIPGVITAKQRQYLAEFWKSDACPLNAYKVLFLDGGTTLSTYKPEGGAA